MKTLTLTLTYLLSLSFMFGQTFDVETIFKSGPNDKRINLVLLGDGYQTSEMAKYINDVNSFTNAFFQETPYKEYKNYFNVYAIKVPSNESGADHPGTATDVSEPGSHPVIDVDNYFGSTFDYFNIHRLLVPTNNTAITNVLANNFPEYDQVIVLVNSSFYGGSGGQYATTSTHASSNDIAIHEIGHSFSDLSDEYYAGDVYARESINMTQETDPTKVKWKNWMNDNGVGIYQHSGTEVAKTWYRPHQACMMRQLSNPFCSVCTEGTVEKIHALVSPIDAYLPDNTDKTTISDTTDFSVTLINPIPNTLSTEWKLNNTTINTDVNTVSITPQDLAPGDNQLQVLVNDTTDFLRVDNHNTIHIYNVLWTVNAETLSINNITTNALGITTYPNPTTSILNIELNDALKEDYTVSIYNISGQKLITKNASKNDKITTLNLEKLSKGTYIIEFNFSNGMSVSKKLIKD